MAMARISQRNLLMNTKLYLLVYRLIQVIIYSHAMWLCFNHSSTTTNRLSRLQQEQILIRLNFLMLLTLYSDKPLRSALYYQPESRLACTLITLRLYSKNWSLLGLKPRSQLIATTVQLTLLRPPQKLSSPINDGA
jgi:hypothetical protein